MVRLTAITEVAKWYLAAALLLTAAGLPAQSTPAVTNSAAAAQSTPVTPKATAAPTHRSTKHSKRAASQPEVVQAPQAPPTPEQMPPAQPKVSYQGGQLTIESHNSTLGQVLRLVQSKTGASFDIPSGANSERVVAQLGPGQARDVLATLLNGSKFDYVILGVANQPGAVQKVILTTRQSTSPQTNMAQNRPAQPPPQEDAQQEEDYTPPEPVEDNSAAQEQNQQPQQGPYRPGGFAPGQGSLSPDGQAQPLDANGQPQQNGVKTPEQLLQELQRMQTQQQQYQQQLNPANQNQQPNFQPQEPQ